MFARIPFRGPEQSPAFLTGPFRPVLSKPAIKAVISSNLTDLSRIYEDGVNLCVIERLMPKAVEQFIYQALQGVGSIEVSQPVDPMSFDFGRLWPQASHLPGYGAWLDDLTMLISLFCDLFECREAGLRLLSLDKAMCPRFHVDRGPVRLVCSYGGIGTEWLPEYALDRRKLGMGGLGKPDNESGLITDPTAIRQMPAFALGLMKGENWAGNEGQGLVHRSPQPTAAQPRRLLLTLDLL
ncbi:MAG: hypothetical protein CTY34_09985 [Methylobacter sp.]|nr:MAG: hypothetical protein CTY34_09985 [Methylobacter sp.]PPD17837.1 MAG: hypothetical protein CTY24_14145 [Methylobacter sp.]